MRRRHLVVICLGVLTGAVAFEGLIAVLRSAVHAPVRAAADRAGQAGEADVLVVGDSFAYGVGAETGWSWPDQLAARREARGAGARIVSLAFPGASSSQAVAAARRGIEQGVRPAWIAAAMGNNNFWNVRSASFWTDFPRDEIPVPLWEWGVAATGMGRAWAAHRAGAVGWPKPGFDLDAAIQRRATERAKGRDPAAGAALGGHVSFEEPVVDDTGIWRDQVFLERWLAHDHAVLCALAAEHGARLAVVTYHWSWRYVRRAQRSAITACDGAILVDTLNFGIRTHPAIEFVSRDGWHPNARGYATIARRVDEGLEAAGGGP